MQNRKYQIWLPLVFALVLIGGMFIGYKLSRDRIGVAFFQNEKISPLDEIMGLVHKDYVDPINMGQFEKSSIQSILGELDPHSVYITPSEVEKINDEIAGSFKGIGVEYQIKEDTAIVLNVLKDGPSEKANVLKGDRLLAVNQISLIGKNFNNDSIKQRLNAVKDSKITLTVLRQNKKTMLEVKRGLVPVPSVVTSYMIEPQTGYIKIVRFSETTYPEFMIAMEKLQKQGMKQLILDLRDNGGGPLQQAVDVADEFLKDNKLVVYTQGANIGRKDFVCKRDGVFEKGKLVVLVDEGTASASEIVAGSLQDWDRAEIIGRRTFGKGLVQEQYNLSNGGALRLTVARYYTPLGRCLQKPYDKGIEAYENELENRLEDGELLHGDTSHNRGKAYKTPSGKLVYDGGGITPDIFIPYDTMTWSKPAYTLYSNGLLNEFALNYYDQHIAQLKSYTTPSEMNSKYQVNEEEWNQLTEFALAKGIHISDLNPIAKANLKDEMKANVAKLMWYPDGYYFIRNSSDPDIQRALLYLKNGK